jgi:hypothetical protein
MKKDGLSHRCRECVAAYDRTRPRGTIPLVTADRLRELLFYDPDSGEFSDRMTGLPVGALNDNGYLLISLNGRPYRAHRLAWLHQKGEWPARHLDHHDLDRANNRWNNLRPATRSQNGANRRVQANNRIGIKGVYPMHGGKFVARIKVDGKGRHLGVFGSAEDASAAYAAAAVETWGEYARFGGSAA